MTMAEKLIALRKCRGWSQEELAEQLDVSRQSVSKWESGASLPDLERVLKLCDIFGVSTDYLLRDDYAEPDAAGVPDAPQARSVSAAEANAYLALVEEEAPIFATATMLCVLSPVPLLALIAATTWYSQLNSDVLICLGIAVLLVMVALAVRKFITGGVRLNPYEFLEKEPIQISAALQADVEARQAAYQSTYSAGLVRGVTLSILSVIPLLLAAGSHMSAGSILMTVCLLLILVAIATHIFVRTGMIQESYHKLLQTGDYTPQAKQNAPLAWGYWCVVTAIYLAASFITGAWEQTWIVWPVAGVLFGAFAALQRVFADRR